MGLILNKRKAFNKMRDKLQDELASLKTSYIEEAESFLLKEKFSTSIKGVSRLVKHVEPMDSSCFVHFQLNIISLDYHT